MVDQDAEFEFCAEQLASLAEPVRLQIVCLLLDRTFTVGRLCARLNGSITNVSYHLQVLARAQIVAANRRGKEMVYSLAPGLVRFEHGQRWLNLSGMSFGITPESPKADELVA